MLPELFPYFFKTPFKMQCFNFIFLSSGGARFNEPPHTMHALVFLRICLRLLIGKEIFARTSSVSAVPAGLVMLLEDVLGIVKPAAAIIGTKTIVVLFPGMPPIECLSIIGYLFSFNTSPYFAIDLVSIIVSSMLITFV